MYMSRTERMKTAVSYGLVYLLWAITLPLGGWMLYNLRDTILTTLAIMTAHNVGQNVREAFYANLQLRAADTTSWLFVGVVMVILIIAIENILRFGMLAGQLWSRFFLVVAVCLSVLCLTNLANDLLRLDVGGFTWRGLFAPVIYAIFAGVFFWSMRMAGLKEKSTPDG
jgi:membrane protease YdiL (CAAX protease family)